MSEESRWNTPPRPSLIANGFLLLVSAVSFFIAFPGISLFLLFGMQCTLLGASDSLDAGKVVYAASYFVLLSLWIASLSIQIGTLPKNDPIIGWTAALMCLCVFSRFAGMLSGISTMAWMRDFVSLLNFSWIFIGPIAFSSARSVRRAYFIVLSIVGFLTVVVTSEYLFLRGYSSGSLGWTNVIKTSDAVVLYGVFLSMPMVAVPELSSKARIATVFFVVAALLTGTRIHIVAMIAGFIFFAWVTRKSKLSIKRFRLAMSTAAISICLFGAVILTGTVKRDAVVGRFLEVTGPSYMGAINRLNETIDAWHAFSASPLLGQGLGYEMPTVFIMGDSEDIPDLYIVHNFYAYIPAKFGLLGIPIFFGFLFSLVVFPMRMLRLLHAPFEKALCAGTAALVVSLLVESLTSSRFTDKTSTALLSMLMAMILALRTQALAPSIVKL